MVPLVLKASGRLHEFVSRPGSKADNLKIYESTMPEKMIVDLQQYAKNKRGRAETHDGALPTLTTNSGSLFSRVSWLNSLNQTLESKTQTPSLSQLHSEQKHVAS